MTSVLIVEDEPVLRLTFAQFLREDEHEVVVAQDYDEACARIQERDFDVIITDIILPGRSGVELLRTVHDANDGAMVIVITGQPDVDSAAEAVRLGAFDYITKPVSGPELKRAVRQALERKQLKEERDRYAARMDRYRRDLEAIFDGVNEGIITAGADWTVERANPKAHELMAAKPGSLTGQDLRTTALGKNADVLSAIEAALASGAAAPETRVAIAGPNGAELILMVAVNAIQFDDRGESGVILMLRDITRLIRLEEEVEGRQQFANIIGRSKPMRELFLLVEDLAETDSTALIYGESGTGKELFAAALHHASPRKEHPFVRVNCAALSEGLLESELFGHVKGAFTGAIKDRVGRFEAANGGTILLDEIGDVTPRLQLRLLRVLQEREFERVGDTVTVKTDVRVIASTNQNLEDRIRRGEFRQDLYYRLNVVRLVLPPLRERREDIPLLVAHFIRGLNRRLKREVMDLSPEVLSVFMRYPWPGNVRELENCIERAMIVCHEPVIQLRHLPPEIQDGTAAGHFAGGQPERSSDTEDSQSREAIVHLLNQTDWNIAKSARMLGIARNTLYQRMKALNIERPNA